MSEKQVKEVKKEEAISWASNPGDPIQKTYKSVYVEKEKRFRVVESGTINVYEIIQASSSTADMAILQRRLIELGEVPAVSRDVQGGIDYSMYPENIHELYKLKEKAEIGFKALPEDLRTAVGSVDVFMKKALDGSFAKFAKDFYAKKAAEVAAGGSNE